MTDDHTMTEDTFFEQKLAAHRPKLLREITLPQGNSPFSLAVALYSGFMGYRHLFDQKFKPQIMACACCFLLGAVTMFLLMTWCFDRTPMRSQPLAANKPIRTYTVPLQMQDLDGVTSPAELLTRIRRQPVMTLKPEPQRTMLQAFPDVFHYE